MNEVSLTVNLSGPEPRNATTVYHLAQGFYLAANRALLNIEVAPGVRQCLVTPGVVNLCLAIELFLKAVILHDGQIAPKTHDLAKLVSLVPSQFAAAVESEYNRLIPDPNFDRIILEASDYFVKVRYGHEFAVPVFHESPLAALGKIFYSATASLVGERTGLQALRP